MRIKLENFSPIASSKPSLESAGELRQAALRTLDQALDVLFWADRSPEEGKLVYQELQALRKTVNTLASDSSARQLDDQENVKNLQHQWESRPAPPADPSADKDGSLKQVLTNVSSVDPKLGVMEKVFRVTGPARVAVLGQARSVDPTTSVQVDKLLGQLLPAFAGVAMMPGPLSSVVAGLLEKSPAIDVGRLFPRDLEAQHAALDKIHQLKGAFEGLRFHPAVAGEVGLVRETKDLQAEERKIYEKTFTLGGSVLASALIPQETSPVELAPAWFEFSVQPQA